MTPQRRWWVIHLLSAVSSNLKRRYEAENTITKRSRHHRKREELDWGAKITLLGPGGPLSVALATLGDLFLTEDNGSHYCYQQRERRERKAEHQRHAFRVINGGGCNKKADGRCQRKTADLPRHGVEDIVAGLTAPRTQGWVWILRGRVWASTKDGVY